MGRNSKSTRPEVLILEDDPRVLRRHKNELEAAGFQCYPTCWAEEAVIIASANPAIRFALIDIILCIPISSESEIQASLMYVTEDLQSLNGEGVVRRINSLKPRLDIKFIFITFAPQQRSEGRVITMIHEAERLKKFRGVIDVIHRYELEYESSEKTYRKIIAQINDHQNQIVRAVNFLHQDTKIVACAQSVCQVQIHQTFHSTSAQSIRVQLGTGWLIAPNLILTCWHLFEKAEDEFWLSKSLTIDIEATIAASQVTFNYLTSDTGTHYSIEELVAKNSQLDYVLLRLRDRQDAPLSQCNPLQLDEEDPTISHPDLVVIQHPQNYPQCRSEGWYVQPVVGKESTHIWYKAQTEQGTSGAPVINLNNFGVTALHTGVTQIKERNYELQEAVLIKAIKEDLHQQHPEIYHEIFCK